MLDGNDRFRYQLLSRIKSDCEYYLNQGKRHPKHLWAGNEEDHITAMETLWNSFDDDKKPEWITWNQIQSYKYQLLNNKD